MEPKKVIIKIMDYIGRRGVVAGGAVRDITLGRTPKDYDIFIFNESIFESIVNKKGIFDKVPTETMRVSTSQYPMSFKVYNTTLSNLPVQIIWNSKYKEGCTFIYTGKDIVNGFDFTINMMYVDYKKVYHITGKAKIALKKKKIIFNSNHSSAFFEPTCSVDFLFRRMVYLADKLGFTIDQKVMRSIYQKYEPYDEEMETLQL